MLIVLIPTILLVIGIILIVYVNKTEKYNKLIYFLDEFAPILTLISGILTVVMLIFLVCSRTGSKTNILNHESLQTIYLSDELRGEYDRATILIKVIESNDKILSNQYYANSIWTNWFYVDEIRNVELIKP